MCFFLSLSFFPSFSHLIRVILHVSVVKVLISIRISFRYIYNLVIGFGVCMVVIHVSSFMELRKKQPFFHLLRGIII